MKPFKITVVLSVALFGLVALMLRLRYGGGEPYPDLTTEPLFDSTALEVVAVLDEPPGNIAVSATGRIFFTIHPESRPESIKVAEWVNGRTEPFPDRVSQSTLYDAPQGIRIDRQNRLWTIDHANNGIGQPRLVVVDIATRHVVHRFDFPSEVAGPGSYLQDLVIDSAGGTAYIADLGFWKKKPGLIIYDMATQTPRRVLDDHESVVAQDWIIRTSTRDMTFFGGLAAMKPGVDGITLDVQNEWLIYGAMCHENMYRVRTADLLDSSLSTAQLSDRIQIIGRKPLSDGLTVDSMDNIYITDVEHSAIVRMMPDGRLQTLIKDSRIRWADGFSFGPDGWLYVADSAIPDLILQSKDHIQSRAPYYLFRFRPEFSGRIGQ